jgi:hypothetical protein
LKTEVNGYRILYVNGKGRDHSEDIGIDGKIILERVLDWMHLALDRDKWWAVVNIVMNLWVP